MTTSRASSDDCPGLPGETAGGCPLLIANPVEPVDPTPPAEPTPDPSGGCDDQPPATPGPATTLTTSVKARKSISRKRLARKGVKVQVACSTACRFVITVRAGGKTLKTKRRSTLLAGTRSVKTKLKNVKRKKLKIVVFAADSDANETTVSRKLRVRK